MLEFSETKRDGGFHEIGVYVPEVIKGAGHILVAVISRQCTDGKWCLYSSRGGSVGRYKTKKLALLMATDIAIESDAAKFHTNRNLTKSVSCALVGIEGDLK